MPQPDQNQVKYRKFGDHAATREAIFANALEAVRNLAPAENSRYRLAIENPHYAKDDTYSIADHKKAILEGRSLSRRLVGTFALHDKASGNVVDKRTMTVAAIPWLTDHGTFLQDGTGLPVSAQLRLLPGIYTRRTQAGRVESHVNLPPGSGVSHHISLDPETGVFKTRVGQAEIPTLPLLRALGVPDDRIKSSWGDVLFARNAKAEKPHHLARYWEKFGPPGPVADGTDLRQALKDRLEKFTIDPWVAKRTIGLETSNYGGEPLLAATNRVLDVVKGKAEPDERDHPAFSFVMGPEHSLPERLSRAGPLLSKALWGATNIGSLKRMTPGLLSGAVRSLFTKSGFALTAEGNSSAEYIDHGSRITKVGEGGIGRNADSVPSSARDWNPGQFPFIDSTRTSESSSVGVDLRTAFGTRLGSDRRIYAPIIDRRTNRLVYKNPQHLFDATVAMPGVMNGPHPVVEVIRNGKLTYAPKEEVDYVVPAMEQSFSPLTNMVPLKSASKAHRPSMGARYIAQSLPLQDPESPLVRAQVPNQPGKSFEELYGRHMGPIYADPKQHGIVSEVTPDHVKVRYADGTTKAHELYRAFPSGRMTGLQSIPAVKPGDQLAPGQMLASSNYTDAQGHAAPGKNLRVALMLGRGSVTPDTLVLWYGRDGGPRYTPISEVVEAECGLSLDTEKLTVSPSPMVQVWVHPADNVVEVLTDTGRRVRATTNHSFVVLDDDLQIREVATSDLLVGQTWVPRANHADLPVVASHYVIPGTARTRPVQIDLDWDFGFVCGVYAAEGCRSRNKAIFAMVDPVMRSSLVASLGRIFPGVVPRYRERLMLMPSGKIATSGALWVGDVRLAEWLETHCGRYSENKKIPDIMFGAPIECRKGFLAGYWAGDGRVHSRKKGGPKDTDTLTTSLRLRNGLGLLMASLGISTTHGQYACPACTHGMIYRLGVSTRDAHKMPFFPHTDKWDRLQGVVATYRGRGQDVPGAGTADMVPVTASAMRLLRNLAKIRYTSRSKIYSRISAGVTRGSRFVSRRDVLGLVDSTVVDQQLLRLRSLALSPMEWDLVVSVEKTDYSGDVYDLDMGARRTFVCVDTLVVHNSVYEDSVLISQSAAKKLSSHHLYSHSVEPDDETMLGKHAHAAAFGGKHTLDVLKSVGDDGLVKPGTIVNYGDPLILAVRRKVGEFGRLSRSGRAALSDASETWEHHEPGKVEDVINGPNGPIVSVSTVKPMTSGDKISGRFGNKGIVVVSPDHEMPVGEDGKPVEVVFSSLGTISRANPSAVYESILGKIASKTGKPYVVSDFDDQGDGRNIGAWVAAEARKHGVKFKENLTDPKTGRTIPSVGVGQMYLMKLLHIAEKKQKGRGLGAYDETGQPLRGQSGKAMRSSLGDTNALLSHGATAVISDDHLGKGAQNEEFWAQYMQGYPATKPSKSPAFDRFLTETRAALADPVRKEDGRYHIMALTNQRVHELAGDRVVRNGETIDLSRNGEPYPGGLFDPAISGAGDSTSTWAKIPLHEPMLNPAMEQPARRLLGLTEKSFRETIAGRHSLATGTGPKAITEALSRIDVPTELKRVREQMQSSRKTVREEAGRRLFYLKGLERTGQSPKDWVLDAMPVLPPAFRPVRGGGPHGEAIVHDANLLYSELINSNNALKDLSALTHDVGQEHLNLYDAMKAVVGLGDPIGAKNRERGVKGVLGRLLGDTAKRGFVQQKLLGTPINLAGRAQALPNPDLDMDQVGLPEKVAWEIYHPFVMRRLIRSGMGRVEAATSLEDRNKVAKDHLLAEMEVRPVRVTRYPALHRYATAGFRPVLSSSDGIEINHMVTKPYGADYDGDAYTVSVPLSDEAVSETYDKLLPSRNLFSPAGIRVTPFKPMAEYAPGLYHASTHDEGNAPIEFPNRQAAMNAYNSGHPAFGVGTKVRIADES